MATAIDTNTIVNVDQRSPPDPRLEKTTNSPQMQSADIQAIHFQNCGIVYLNSFNTHSIAMEDCANHVPQVTLGHVILSDNFPRNIDYEKSDNVLYPQSYRHPDFHGSIKDPPRTFGMHRSFSINDVVLLSGAAFAAGSCITFFLVNLPRLCDAGVRQAAS
ncbi:hypothetical protein BYT27DRAFT_7335937 [Phlegmacium glaucopus]|nr:hypothetical protein BYT27DRAFT_7335937 [Phlegmacium glaucopus]